MHPTSVDDVADQFTEPTTTDEALALSILESATVLEAVVRASHETLAKRRAADLHALTRVHAVPSTSAVWGGA